MLVRVSLILQHMSTIRPPFRSRFITSNFSSVLTVFCRIFTLMALGDVHLRFPLTLVGKANAVEEETKWAAWLYQQHNQFIDVTNGITVTSLSASLLQIISVAMDYLCPITLNRQLSFMFKKRCKFLSHVKVKSRKTRLAYTSLTQDIQRLFNIRILLSLL
jgi:hypothetical protein